MAIKRKLTRNQKAILVAILRGGELIESEDNGYQIGNSSKDPQDVQLLQKMELLDANCQLTIDGSTKAKQFSGQILYDY